ncbi:hypothetical protein D9M68_205220 [compost metagenome]
MKLRTWLVTGCLAASLPVQASLFTPIELTDGELAQLRGRYVLPGRIVSFGVTMASTWQNANGQVLSGQISMQVQQGIPTPVFNVTTFNQNGGDSSPPPTGQISGGNGLGSVQGVVQSSRSAGDYNASYNNVNIEVTHGNQAPTSISGQPQLSTVENISDAGVVRIAPHAGGFQLAIQPNGQGASLQQLAAGGVIQRTDILGSNNRVENLAALNVMLRENMPSASGLNCAWDQLNIMRPTGY